MSFIILLRRLSRKIHHSHNEPTSRRRRIDHSPPITDLSPKVSQMAKYAKERAFSLGRSGVSHDSQYGLRWGCTQTWQVPWWWFRGEATASLTPMTHNISQYLPIKWDTFNQKTITGCKNERMNLCSESKNQRLIIQWNIQWIMNIYIMNIYIIYNIYNIYIYEILSINLIDLMSNIFCWFPQEN